MLRLSVNSFALFFSEPGHYYRKEDNPVQGQVFLLPGERKMRWLAEVKPG